MESNHPWKLGQCWGVGESILVPQIEKPNDAFFRHRFFETKRPVKIKGLLNSWPALRKWSFDDLRRRFGDRVVPVVCLEDGLVSYSTKKGALYQPQLVSKVLDAVEDSVESGKQPNWYISVKPEQYFPEICDEVERPAYCSRALWRSSRLWVGGGCTTTPIHRELTPNILSVVRGKKELILFVPRDGRGLYPFAPWSRVPHLCQVNPEKPDLKQFPKARFVEPWRVMLEEGDSLFVPPLWWHAVQTSGFSIAINFWWAEGALSILPRMADLYKTIVGFSV